MKRLHSILLVEDNPADVTIAQRAIREGNLPIDLIPVRDGQEALDYLQQQGAWAERRDWRCPELILLDINLPLLGGRELLERLRDLPRFRTIPVVVLTTSRHQEDVVQMYASGANTYIEKPANFQSFVQTLKLIHQYWLDLAILPPISE
jgi:two-component system response regulator